MKTPNTKTLDVPFVKTATLFWGLENAKKWNQKVKVEILKTLNRHVSVERVKRQKSAPTFSRCTQS